MNAPMQIANPFQSQQNMLSVQNNAMIEAESQRSIAEVQAAMIIAKRFPRDSVKAMDKILNVCQRPSLANNAVYQHARGGNNITGASIRLAEAIAQQWVISNTAYENSARQTVKAP